MRALITGITGMIGKHLAELLVKNGCKVAGISRATSAARYMHGDSAYKHYRGDILDVNFLARVWQEWQPEIIYHFAAQAYNGESWEAENTTYLLNITGSRNVLSICRKYSPEARIIPACSSAEYGIVPEHLIPIREDTTPLCPISPYGVSKACLEMMCRQHQLNYHMDIVIPRLFIHVGPDHPPVTALQNFAMQLAAIKLGLQESVMKVGNLDTSRDFVDVRDGAKALWILAQKGQSGQVYNQCSGKAWSIRKSLEILIDISGMDVKVTQDRRLMRLSDEKILLGDPSKLESLGWKSSIPFRKTLEDIFENWIDRLSDSSTCTERQSHKLR